MEKDRAVGMMDETRGRDIKVWDSGLALRKREISFPPIKDDKEGSLPHS